MPGIKSLAASAQTIASTSRIKLGIAIPSKVAQESPRCACGALLQPKRNASQWVPSSSTAPAHSTVEQIARRSFYFYPSFYSDNLRTAVPPVRLPRGIRRRLLRSRTTSPLHLQALLPAITALSSRPTHPIQYVWTSKSLYSVSPHPSAHSDDEPPIPPPPTSIRTSLQPAFNATRQCAISPKENEQDRGRHHVSSRSYEGRIGIDAESSQRPKNRDRWTPGTHAYIRRSCSIYRSIVQRLIETGDLARARSYYLKASRKLHSQLVTKKLVTEARLFLSQILTPHIALNETDKMEDLINHFENTFPHKYDPFAYTLLVHSYTRQLDADRAFDAIRRLKAHGHRKLQKQTYADLMTLFARRRDPESARLVFEAMLKDWPKPPISAYTALMNAYVESGLWDAAISIFDYIDVQPKDSSLKPDIFVFTTLLKAYVLMGAPFNIVMALFKNIASRDLLPSAHTYSLLLQSACDAGLYEIAEEIFANMDKGEESGGVRPNVYTFSIVIRGLLRGGKREEAHQYYTEMLRRGIASSPVTWSTMISAYSKIHDASAQRVMQGLLDTYLSSWSQSQDAIEATKTWLPNNPDDTLITRATALESVFGPVIDAYAKGLADSARTNDDDELESATISPAGQALRAFERMISIPGSKPSIHIYTTLLDAFRRENNIDQVEAMWKAVLDLALDMTAHDYTSILDRQSPSHQDVDEIAPGRHNLLCLPFSIYIDALSANHKHDEIARTWVQLQRLGFGFDATNWNNLIVALLRAGEVDRAFWTAERVLLEPRLPKSASSTGTVSQPVLLGESQSSEIVDVESRAYPSEEEQIAAARVEPPVRPPNRAHEQHAREKEHIRRHERKIDVPETGSTADPQFGSASQITSATGLNEVLRPLTSHQSGLRLPFGLQRSAMTVGFETLQAKRKQKVWTVHAATLIELEASVRRLERASNTTYGGSDENEADLAAGKREKAAVQLQALQQQYPLSVEAIETYREGISKRMRSLL